jgi:hypothetical protein
MSYPKPFIALVALLVALATGFSTGVHWANTRAQAASAVQVQSAGAAYAQATVAGDAAVKKTLSTQREQEARYETLDPIFKALRRDVPLLAGGDATRGCVATDLDLGVEAQAQPINGTQAGGIALSASAGLSLGAVRLWDSALFSTDLATGACGAVGASAGAGAADDQGTDQATGTRATGAAPLACAQDSGLTVDSAWDNQAQNARRWAGDRLRFNALIDFIEARQKQEQSRPTTAGEPR